MRADRALADDGMEARNMRKNLALLLVVCLLFAPVAALAAGGEVATFQDPMFEKRVRKMLDRPEGDIYASELAPITELYFANFDYPGEIPDEEKIHDLTDLKYFPNLEKLDIGVNAVSDLTPLSSLDKLYYLEAPRNNISDLSPLSGMTQLTWAVFWENDISDLTPVANLVNLETFSVFSNNVTDLSPLANLTKLTILEVFDNPVEDMSPVAGILENIEKLSAGAGGQSAGEDVPATFADPAFERKLRRQMDRPEGDIYASECAEIRELCFANWAYPPDAIPEEEIIFNLSDVRYFPNLVKLEIEGSAVHDLSPLAELYGLKILDAQDNKIGDLSPLSGIVDLAILKLGHNMISDLSPLAGLVNLNELSLYTNEITDVSPLAGMTKLTNLYLAGNPIADFSPLAALYPNLSNKDFDYIDAAGIPDDPIEIADARFEKALRAGMGIYDRPITRKDAYLVTVLDVSNDKSEGSQFTDISPLQYFTNLKRLSMNSNLVSDLSPLADLTRLEWIDMHFNQISDLSPLSGLKNLQGVWLPGNQIADLSPLSGLENLSMVNVSANRIEDYAPLLSLPRLSQLYISENPGTDYSVLKDIYPSLTDKDFEIK